jgi:outer membrane cobalamin receptor
LLLRLLAAPARAGEQEAGAAPHELPDILIIGASPLPGTGVPPDRYPGNVQTISSRQLGPGAGSLTDAIAATVGSANVNDTQGNGLQMDLNIRGYTASPVLGTPQGLCVYVDGVRVNEPFGDVVSWDLIPQAAIANLTVLPGSNPVFGFNSLGGALTVNTKSGFAYPGTRVSVGGGSFGRRSLDAEWGGHGEKTDAFIAASAMGERGWSHFNASRLDQVFAKAGYQDRDTDVDFSVQTVDDLLAGNQLVPQSMLSNAAQGYSHPDTTATRNFSANLAGSHTLGEGDRLDANGYYRNIRRSILNSNINDPVAGEGIAQLTFCRARFGEACAANVLSDVQEDISGLNLQYSRETEGPGPHQIFNAGVSGQVSDTDFTQFSQDGVLDAGGGVVGISGSTPQSAIRAQTNSAGIYATDTVLLGALASVTLSLRLDHSRIALAGTSVDGTGNAVRVDGDHDYRRANPALGGTIAVTPLTTVFANIAQGFRAPSAIELACADARHPCAGVPNAFSADPKLDGIRAYNLEMGLRGHGAADGEPTAAEAPPVSWRMAAFASRLHDDILFNQSSLSTGYFSNVGATRRDGVEAAIDGARGRVDFGVSASVLYAVFASGFTVANPANAGATCPGIGCVPVRPGDRIPAIAPVLAKLHGGYALGPDTRLDTEIAAQGPSYARGDENNLDSPGRLPGFALVNVGLRRKLATSVELTAKVRNLMNRQTANFGMLADNNRMGGVPENFWAVGQPRSVLLGIEAAW